RRRERGVFRDDDVNPGSGRLRALRDFQLRATEISIVAQSGVLVRCGLSWNRPERFLDDWSEPLAERLRFSRLRERNSFRQIGDRFRGRADAGDETRGTDF